jgi:hypothetical protein
MVRRKKEPPFKANRGLTGAYVEKDGEHFATLHMFDAAQEFARILNDLEQLSTYSAAFVGNGTIEQSRWRVGALIAKHFGVVLDHSKGSGQ